MKLRSSALPSLHLLFLPPLRPDLLPLGPFRLHLALRLWQDLRRPRRGGRHSTGALVSGPHRPPAAARGLWQPAPGGYRSWPAGGPTGRRPALMAPSTTDDGRLRYASAFRIKDFIIIT